MSRSGSSVVVTSSNKPLTAANTGPTSVTVSVKGGRTSNSIVLPVGSAGVAVPAPSVGLQTQTGPAPPPPLPVGITATGAAAPSVSAGPAPPASDDPAAFKPTKVVVKRSLLKVSHSPHHRVSPRFYVLTACLWFVRRSTHHPNRPHPHRRRRQHPPRYNPHRLLSLQHRLQSRPSVLARANRSKPMQFQPRRFDRDRRRAVLQRVR